jgi:hypothetical protein
MISERYDVVLLAELITVLTENAVAENTLDSVVKLVSFFFCFESALLADGRCWQCRWGFGEGYTIDQLERYLQMSHRDSHLKHDSMLPDGNIYGCLFGSPRLPCVAVSVLMFLDPIASETGDLCYLCGSKTDSAVY